MTEPSAAGLGRVAARLARVTERSLGELGLSLPQYRVLSLLDGGSAAGTALADHLAVSRPHVTAVVDGLVERGWVERRPDRDDRRRVSHVLTDGGRDMLAAADQAVEARLLGVLGQLPPGLSQRAATGLGLWARALDAARDARVGAG
jgi:DNA-binding MarR family transcriptional regulator